MAWMCGGGLLTAGLLVGVSLLPSSSRKSVGHQVTEFRVPLGIKAASYLYRDWMYRNLVTEITAQASTDVERVNALYDWVVSHIRIDVPADWAVEDDHPLHVIIRGYGLNWQVADVFSVLCAYAGVPAMTAKAMASDKAWLVVALVKLGGQWRVMDPYYRNRFTADDGLPVTLEAMRNDPSWVRLAEHQPVVDGRPYAAYFRQIRPTQSSGLLRPYQQMWWPRLWHEVRQWGRRLTGYP